MFSNFEQAVISLSLIFFILAFIEIFSPANSNLLTPLFIKEVVEFEYGYHIILKTGSKDKPKLEEVKDEIIDVLVEDLKEEDDRLQFKALIELRKEQGVEFQDTELKKQYKTYIENNTKNNK